MRTLSSVEYEELLGESKILMKDGHSIKVREMPGGNFLKTVVCKY
jgi:hypothetical protein